MKHFYSFNCYFQIAFTLTIYINDARNREIDDHRIIIFDGGLEARNFVKQVRTEMPL